MYRHWLFNTVLIVLAGMMFLGTTGWLTFSKEALQPVKYDQNDTMGKYQDGTLQVILTDLVAKEISSPTSSVEIRATTAELMDDWSGIYLQDIEGSMKGLDASLMADLVSSGTVSVFFRGGRQGWFDSDEGNLLIVGDIHLLRSDGHIVSASRMEYESKNESIRLYSAHIKWPTGELQSPVIMTDPQLRRIRQMREFRSTNPFFVDK